MAQTSHSSIADLLAEANLRLQTALQLAQENQPLDSLGSATMARLAAEGNTSCTNNTGCTRRPGVQ
jgi:hypothetical protein